MRILVLILLPSLVGCEKNSPINCNKVDYARVERCMDQNLSKGEATMNAACLPFSDRLKTSGVWVVGFEKNDFFEGPNAPPAQIMWHDSTGVELIVDEKLYTRKNEIEALQVDLTGKRALCPAGVINSYPIAVEELRIRRRLGTR